VNRRAERGVSFDVRLTSVALTAAAVAATACGGAATSAAGNSGTGTISGTVLRAPTCPVERAASSCPPGRVAGAEVDAVRGTTVVARTTTSAGGTFRLTVASGTYTVIAYNTGGLRTSARRTVAVAATGRVEVTLTVDSGIR
jgi:hypothetical protein